MPKEIDTIRFLEFGKPAPENSRFKGIINTETLFGSGGFFEYTSREEAVQNNEPDRLVYNGFLGYTSREEATSSTLTNLGYLNDKNKKAFIELGRSCFCKPNDLAWDVVISFESYEMMEQVGIRSQKDYGAVIEKVLPVFFKKVGLDPDNMVWWENYHCNKAHPHFHLVFMEKEKTRSRGKFTEKELKMLKREIIKETLARPSLENKTGRAYQETFTQKDEIREVLMNHVHQIDLSKINTIDELYKALPRSGRLQYNSRMMKPYKPVLNKLVNQLLHDPSVAEDLNKFMDKVDILDKTMNDLAGTEIGTMKEAEIKKLYSQIGNIILDDYKKTYLLDSDSKRNNNENKKLQNLKNQILKNHSDNAMNELVNLADQGNNAAAQYSLGVVLLKIAKTDTEKEEANRWIERSKQGGYKPVQSSKKNTIKRGKTSTNRLLPEVKRLLRDQERKIDREIDEYLYGNHVKGDERL